MYSVEYNQNCILYELVYIFSTLLSLIVRIYIYMHEEE